MPLSRRLEPPGEAHNLLLRMTGDDGFTLVEALVAMTILAVAVTFLSAQVVTSLSSALAVKEHSSATALLSEAVAKAQSLPFSSLQAGLNPTTDDLGADPNISKPGSTD